VARAGVILTDVSQSDEALRRAGVTLDQVRLKMHAITPDGRVLAGMPAIAIAWAATPPYRFLGRLMQIAPFSWIGAGVYHVSAHALWAWNRACGRW
jgi:predicted DCC family thiol-disulfide oxidoreductase YuxK